MVHRRAFRALAAAMALSLAGADAANAEFAASITLAGSPIFDGLKGNMGIRTDPATVVGVGYVHITQADTGSTGGDFVAIGTANGLGVSSCANDYDAKWTGYYDRIIGGSYFCDDFSLDAYAAGSNPTFQIYYSFCQAANANRWVMTFNGVQRTCMNAGTTGAQALNIGLETTGGSTTDRNIDVKYTNLKKNLTGSTTWSDLGNPGASLVIDPNYSYQFVSNTAQNFYLAPLD